MASPGIRKRHSRGCASRDGDGCSCRPSWEARVWSRRAGPDGKGGTISRSFPTYAAAKGWREDASHANRRGKLRPATRKTVREALEELLDGMRDGSVRSRRKRPYRPSTIRSYERATGLYPEMRERAPERLCASLGDFQLSELTRHDVQDYVERLASAGWDGSTVGNQLDVLRCVYRRARQREEVGTDPLDGLDLPDSGEGRDRIADADEADALLGALPLQDRALWATAFWAGLRRGELRALRVSDLDLKAGLIRVRRSWDDSEGELADGKTDNAARDVPLVVAELRGELTEHLVRTGRRDRDLVFGRTADEPFVPSTVRRDALAAWGKAGLAPITLHEGRHTLASLLIAAGVDAGAISDWMGHSNPTFTYKRYRHLFDDAAERAEKQVAAFLAAQRAGSGGLRAVD
jgi:integrase